MKHRYRTNHQRRKDEIFIMLIFTKNTLRIIHVNKILFYTLNEKYIRVSYYITVSYY